MAAREIFEQFAEINRARVGACGQDGGGVTGSCTRARAAQIHTKPPTNTATGKILMASCGVKKSDSAPTISGEKRIAQKVNGRSCNRRRALARNDKLMMAALIGPVGTIIVAR